MFLSSGCWYVFSWCNHSQKLPALLGVEAEGVVPGGGRGALGRCCLDKPHHSSQAEMMCTSSCTLSQFISKSSNGAVRGIMNAPWGRCGAGFTGMSFQPPGWSGSGMRAAFTLMVSILVSSGTAPGSPLHLEPQVLWTNRGLTDVRALLLFTIEIWVFEIRISGDLTNAYIYRV